MAKELLTDRDLRAMTAGDPPLYDGDGLRFLASPTTLVISAQFKFKRPEDEKPDTFTIGKYRKANGRPGLSLASIRARADAEREKLERGENPKVVKRVEKTRKRIEASNTFEIVAADWAAREARRQKWTPDYLIEVERSIRNHLAVFATMPVARITAPTIAPVLREVERKAPMMLEKVRPRLDAIFDYAVEHGIIPGNPLPAVRRGKRKDRKHYPAVTTLDGVGEILRAARAADPCKGIQRAHQLLAFTALRVSEVVGAKWEEFDLGGVDVAVGDGRHKRHDQDAGNWRVPRERMKRKDKERGPHVVPLPPVLLSVLREWSKADGDGAIYVCPAPRDASRTIVPEACEKFYRNALDLGGKHSPHSWRSAFSTICRDAGKDTDAVEAQLDHVVGNKVAAAYDRAARLELRRALLAWYERTLIAARDGTEVTPIKRRKTVA